MLRNLNLFGRSLSKNLSRVTQKRAFNLPNVYTKIYTNYCQHKTKMQSEPLFCFSVKAKGKSIPVHFEPHIEKDVAEKVRTSKKFNDYLKKIENSEDGVQVERIQVVTVYLFSNGNIGFICLRALTKKDGFSLPSYVFLRGQSVMVLVFVNGKIAVIEQYRVALQKTIVEVPAGMLDEDGDFVSKAAKQLEEETGISIKKEILKPIGSYYPSPGGCDEELHMFYCEISIDQNKMEELEKKIHGSGEKERIRVRFIDYDPQQILKTKDSGLMALLSAYEAKKHQY